MRPLDVLALPLAGTHLIEASAGTGKTWTIAMVALRLVVEQGMAVERILVVTYTRAATAELRMRIRDRLREARVAVDAGTQDEALGAVLARVSPELARTRLEVALGDFDRAAVLTIHGFCQRVLHDNAFESGAAYDTELVADMGPLVRELTQDFWARRLVGAPAAVAAHAYERLRLEGSGGLTLVHRLLAQPEVDVLPTSGPSLEDAVAEWERARVAAAALFDPATVEAAFRAKGKTGKITEWVAELEALLLRPGVPGLDPDGLLAKHLHKLCDGTGPLAQACCDLVAANASLTAARAVLAVELLRFARSELGVRKAAERVRSYDDLLRDVRDGLEADSGLAEGLRGEYHAALIDEFQDTDPIQYRIFERAFHEAGMPLYLIGDPKQAIYGFRGGDVHTYLRAREAAGADRQWTLDVNYRSDPRLVTGLNALFGQMPCGFVIPEIEVQPVQAAPTARDRVPGLATPLTLLALHGDKATPEDIAARVACHLRGLLGSELTIEADARAKEPPRILGPGDVAVLCRTNEQARAVQAALRERNVPSVLGGDASVLDAPEAAELQRLLDAAADPMSRSAVRAAVTTPFLGKTGDDLARAEKEPAEWETWRGIFHDWHDRWRERGFMPAFRHAVESQGVPERLLGLVDGERRLTNLFHLAELLHAAERGRHVGPEGLVYWLEEMRADSEARGDVAPEAMQIRLESDADAVTLTTVHKSKGLEYPVVYCPFLCGDTLLRPGDQRWLRFHDDDGRAVLDLRGRESGGRTPELMAARHEASAEQARVLYVALTRARHATFVVWHHDKLKAKESPLALALHADPPPTGMPRAAAHDVVLEGLKDALDDPARLAADLQRVTALGVGVQPLPAADRTSWTRPPAEARALRAKDKPPRPPVVRSASFSSLTSHAPGERTPSVVVEQGLDLDASPATDGVSAASMLAPLTLAELPPGARTGTLLHTVLEEIDFSREARPAARARVAEVVARFGYEDRWVEPITRSLDDILDTRIGTRARSFTLADVPPERRVSELEFWLPVATPGHGLTVNALADAIQHSGQLWLSQYAARVRTLRFEALAGWLRGFIDLVFEQDGLYWVCDYKSNRLGQSAADYRPDRLFQAMLDGHYVLQYLLYSVAVHRHLKARLRGKYDYRKFGGVLYLFVRGMSPARGMETGVYFERPPQELIEAVDRALAQGGA